MKKINNKKTEE